MILAGAETSFAGKEKVMPAHEPSSIRNVIRFLLLLIITAPALTAQSGGPSRYMTLILGKWSHVSMDITYQFRQDGTFRYFTSSADADLMIVCEGTFKIAGNHLTVQNTKGRVIKGKPEGKACNEEAETLRLGFEGPNTLVLTDEGTHYSDTYTRTRD